VTAGQAPPVAVLHLAMVHGAVYDAVNSIDGGYEPYLGSLPAPSGSSKNAAAATAAYEVLLSILPSREAQLTEYYDASLALIPDGPAESGGVTVGQAAATAMIAERTGDGRSGTDVYEVGTEPGEWRPIPNPNGSPVVNALRWVGLVDPFLIESAVDFATVGPRALGSAEYAAEFDQVKALGGTTSATRTADQTQQAVFWADHAVGMWTRIFRQLSRHQDLSVVENARFFAMLYLTGADAAISCFEDKTKGFWRPQTAIQEAADDGNAATEADATWTSLLQNPPYPDHPSGHNCVSGSFTRTLRQFFGTNEMSFRATRTFAQPGPEPITRTYTTFSQAIQEIRWARVYGGLHFWSAEVQGGRLGRMVANYRNENYFQPVP
jgi:PAP2 superfamily